MLKKTQITSAFLQSYRKLFCISLMSSNEMWVGQLLPILLLFKVFVPSFTCQSEGITKLK